MRMLQMLVLPLIVSSLVTGTGHGQIFVVCFLFLSLFPFSFPFFFKVAYCKRMPRKASALGFCWMHALFLKIKKKKKKKTIGNDGKEALLMHE